MSWQVLNLPAGATYTVVPNPSASAPTVTINKGTLTTAAEGAYPIQVQASYGSFGVTANATLTITNHVRWRTPVRGTNLMEPRIERRFDHVLVLRAAH